MNYSLMLMTVKLMRILLEELWIRLPDFFAESVLLY